METRSLGRTRAQVSVLCLGVMTFGWKTEQDEATAMIDRFLDQSGNFIDTANEKRFAGLVKPSEYVEGQSYYKADFGPTARW